MPRLVAAALSFILRNALSGAFWSIGAAIGERLLKGGLMFRTPKLLFHPKVTMGAFIAGLTSLLTFAPEIKAQYGPKGLLFVIAATVILAVCTYGRSPASAVDNNQIPK